MRASTRPVGRRLAEPRPGRRSRWLGDLLTWLTADLPQSPLRVAAVGAGFLSAEAASALCRPALVPPRAAKAHRLKLNVSILSSMP